MQGQPKQRVYARSIIRDNRDAIREVFLRENDITRLENLYEELHKKRLLTKPEQKNLKKIEDHAEQVGKLLDYLIEAITNQDELKNLVEALRLSGFHEVSRWFTEYTSKKGTKKSPELQGFRHQNLMSIEEYKNQYGEFFQKIRQFQSNTYSTPKGAQRYAFVMSNVEFTNFPASSRSYWGTDDAFHIHGMLHACGFKVTMTENLRKRDFEETGAFCNWIAEINQPKAKPAAIVVVLMSHGDDQHRFMAADSETADGGDWVSLVDSVFPKFKKDESPGLARVPKIFFLQMCRGDERDLDDHIGSRGLDDNAPIPLFRNMKESNYSDMLIVYATNHGYRSLRGWLISGLCQAVRRRGRKEDQDAEDILCILNALCGTIRQLDVQESSKYRKQVFPYWNIAFTNKFFFHYDEAEEIAWWREHFRDGQLNLPDRDFFKFFEP